MGVTAAKPSPAPVRGSGFSFPGEVDRSAVVGTTANDGAGQSPLEA